MFKEYASDQALDFNYRLRRIMAEIKESDSDILCLQEINFCSLKRYETELEKLGYKFIPFWRKRDRFTNAIAFKESKFKKVC
jgi:mRNA deadenylase 3'-5' endonuclease subunit Ccr4